MQITFLHVQGLAVSMFFLSWCWQKGVYLRAWQIFLQVCTNCCYLWHPQKLSLPTPAHCTRISEECNDTFGGLGSGDNLPKLHGRAAKPVTLSQKEDWGQRPVGDSVTQKTADTAMAHSDPWQQTWNGQWSTSQARQPLNSNNQLPWSSQSLTPGNKIWVSGPACLSNCQLRDTI